MTGSIAVVELAKPGGPAALRPVTRPWPRAASGEVVVRAHAIGISSADLMIRRGEYKWMPPLPAVIGNELAGEVVEVGPDVSTHASGLVIGARVLVSAREMSTRGGCYAEAVAVPAHVPFVLPDAIAFVDAVSLPNFQLAGALLTESGIRVPKTIAVYGASGGVGLAIVQLARAMGIRAIGIVSSEEKRAFVRATGVDEVVLRDDDVARRVTDLTEGRGVDVVYALAGPELIRNLDLLAPYGTLLSYSHLGGFMPDADFYGELRKRLGRSLGVRVYSMHSLDEDRVTRRRLIEEAIALMAAGRLRPPRPMLWPLSRAADAHAAMEARSTLGKVALIPDAYGAPPDPAPR